jgi:hypothetical protein
VPGMGWLESPLFSLAPTPRLGAARAGWRLPAGESQDRPPTSIDYSPNGDPGVFFSPWRSFSLRNTSSPELCLGENGFHTGPPSDLVGY